MNFDLEPDLGNANVGKDHVIHASHLFEVACFFIAHLEEEVVALQHKWARECEQGLYSYKYGG